MLSFYIGFLLAGYALIEFKQQQSTSGLDYHSEKDCRDGTGQDFWCFKYDTKPNERSADDDSRD